MVLVGKLRTLVEFELQNIQETSDVLSIKGWGSNSFRRGQRGSRNHLYGRGGGSSGGVSNITSRFS